MFSHLDTLRCKRALVSGGTKGLGAAVVARQREMGAKVLTTARSGAPPADAMFVAADIATAAAELDRSEVVGLPEIEHGHSRHEDVFILMFLRS
jgi:NAD(P)-dependent dehydrogenase (short-subunit alcohol dehydrogenase family)